MSATKILLVKGENPDTLLNRTLKDGNYNLVATIDWQADLLNGCVENKPDIIIFNNVLTEQMLAEIQNINAQLPLPMIIFSNDRGKDTISNVIKAGVCAYVVDNMGAHRIDTIINIAISRFIESQSVKDELEKTKNKLAERKWVERAKGVLIETRGLNEEEAYHTLRKLAMGRKITIGEMARNVISVAELLKTPES